MSYGQDPWQPAGPPQRDPRHAGRGGDGGPTDYPPNRAPSDPYRAPQPPPSDAYGAPRQPWSPDERFAEAAAPTTRSRSRSGSRGAAGAGAGVRPAGPGGRPDAGPGRVNDDLDLDELDPKGRAQRRAAKDAARRRGNPRRRRVLKYTAWTTAGTLLAVGGAGYYVVHKMLGNVATVSLSGLKNRPAPSPTGAENILVLGSQTRDGQTEAVHVGNATKDGTDLSDTAFIVHISADHRWAEVISIPRDLFVPIPACQDRTNPSVTHQAQPIGQFYEAMNEGGPACAVATVEQMTDVRMDHFVELTFDAFIDLTNAVGGVQICVPQPGIDDPNYSGLVLSAGLHTVEGNQALAFVRDRHGLAGGTDTSRIQMQQQFMTALFNKLTSNGTLEDPVDLYKIANAVTSNISVDTGLDNIGTMASIAESVGSINKKYIQYITAPYILDAPGQFSYDEGGDHSSPGAGFAQLWTYVRNDQPLPGSPAAAEFGNSAPKTPTPGANKPSANPSPTTAFKNVTVQVFNSTDIDGEASNAAANLRAMGMTASVGDSGYSGYGTTTIYYPAGDQAEADTLAGQVAGAKVEQSSNVSQLTLVIGADVPSALVATPAAASGSGGSSATASSAPSPTISVEARTGNEDICSNLPGGQYGGKPSD